MKKVKLFPPAILLLFLIGCVSNKNVIIYDNNNAAMKQKEEIEYEILQIPKKSTEEINEELARLNVRESEKYRISSGDIFDIYIDADEKFNTMGAIIKTDGCMSVKRLGEISVEGLTIEEAKALIETRLKEFIKIDPKLSLIPVKIREAQVNILGEVKNPGVYTINSNKRILDIISAAGGISTVILQNEKIDVADLDGAYIERDNRILPVNFTELIVKANYLHNIPLHDKDYIYIPSLVNKLVYVLGEVSSPGKYMLTKEMSVSKLLALSGGIRDTASDNIYVLRGNLRNAVLYKINISGILKEGHKDFPLRKDDIVYVPKSGITIYNDVINKILPTLNLLNSTTDAFIKVDTTRGIIEGYTK